MDMAPRETEDEAESQSSDGNHAKPTIVAINK